MNWFEEWFDSPLYEKLYANRDEKEAAQLVKLLEDTLELNRYSKILDLGCGRGRHSIDLYQKGYDVTGIDLSEQAIATAREKAQGLAFDNIRFQVRDMRNPLPETFDAIVNLFTTFGYFSEDEENIRVLKSVRQMLRPGGIFVLDYLNADYVRRNYRSAEEGQFHDIHYSIKRYIADNSINKEIEFSGELLNEKKKYAERVKLYDLPWFKEHMAHHNLVIDKIFGNYDGDDFDPQESPRLLIISYLEE